MQNHLNPTTYAIGILSGIASALIARYVLHAFDAPVELTIIADLAGGMLAFAIAMFAGQHSMTTRIQGQMSTIGYTVALYTLLLFLEPLDWILGSGFLINAICLNGTAYVLGRLLARIMHERALFEPLEALTDF